MYLGVVFFEFIIFETRWASWILKTCLSPSLRSFNHYVFKSIFYTHFCLFWDSSDMNVRIFDVDSLSIFFPLYYSYYIILLLFLEAYWLCSVISIVILSQPSHVLKNEDLTLLNSKICIFILLVSIFLLKLLSFLLLKVFYPYRM